MDFLVAKGFVNRNFDGAVYKRLALEGWLPFVQKEVSGLTILSVGTPISTSDTDGDLVLFDGSAIGNTGFASNFYPPTARLLSELESDPNEISGSYIFAKVTHGGAVIVRTDALSQYVAFLWTDKNNNRFILSNNIFFVERFLEENSISTKRSVGPFLSHMVYGGAMLCGSGIEDVKMLGDDSQGNDVHSLHVVQCPPRPLLSYEECIERAARMIERNVLTMANYALADKVRRLTYDVTGGKDSRLVFAAFWKNGLHRDFGFRSIRHYPHPDGHYAAMLRERYDLSAAEFDSVDDYSSADEYLDSDVPFHEAFLSVGLGPRHGIIGAGCFPNSIHLHGGFGGGLAGASPDVKRAYRPGPDNLTLEGLLNSTFIRLERAEIFDGITHPAIERIKAVTQGFFRTHGAPPKLPANAPLSFYIRNRSRSHFALISWMRGRTCQYPDVLFSTYIVDAAAHLSLDAMLDAKVSFDIIRSMGGLEILRLPLADRAWGPIADPENISGRMSITSDTPPMFRQEIHRPSRKPVRVMRTSSEAAHLPRDLRQIYYYQRILRQVLGSDSPIFDLFNKTRVAAAVEKEPNLVSGRDYRILLNAVFAAMWCHKMEKPFSIVSNLDCCAPLSSSAML